MINVALQCVIKCKPIVFSHQASTPVGLQHWVKYTQCTKFDANKLKKATATDD